MFKTKEIRTFPWNAFFSKKSLEFVLVKIYWINVTMVTVEFITSDYDPVKSCIHISIALHLLNCKTSRFFYILQKRDVYFLSLAVRFIQCTWINPCVSFEWKMAKMFWWEFWECINFLPLYGSKVFRFERDVIWMPFRPNADETTLFFWFGFFFVVFFLFLHSFFMKIGQIYK